VKKVWAWFKKAGVWIAMALLALVGAGWLWRTQKGKLGAVRDQLAVEKASSRVKELRAQREILKEQDAEAVEEIAKIDEELADNQLAIRDAFENGADATEEEIDAELARLGL
jgi:hypothetical protein